MREAGQHNTEAGYKKYANGLGLPNQENPYLPFTSRLDWEFARWAKLRGPGSTAVSQLISIPGVSEKRCRLRKQQLTTDMSTGKGEPRFVLQEYT